MKQRLERGVWPGFRSNQLTLRYLRSVRLASITITSTRLQTQIAAFEGQLAAVEHDKPVVIHTREAEEDTKAVLGSFHH